MPPINALDVHTTVPSLFSNAMISAKNSTFNEFMSCVSAYPINDFCNWNEFLLTDRISITTGPKSGPNFGLNSDNNSNFVSQSGAV